MVVPVFGQESAPFQDRILYAPGHFGNSYEVMGEHEMRDYLAECKDYGFNRYADWYDTADCTDLFSGQNHMLLGSALWQRKKANFRSAQSLGLPCDLVITPNHVFAEQCGAGRNFVRQPRIDHRREIVAARSRRLQRQDDRLGVHCSVHADP